MWSRWLFSGILKLEFLCQIRGNTGKVFTLPIATDEITKRAQKEVTRLPGKIRESCKLIGPFSNFPS